MTFAKNSSTKPFDFWKIKIQFRIKNYETHKINEAKINIPFQHFKISMRSDEVVQIQQFYQLKIKNEVCQVGKA